MLVKVRALQVNPAQIFLKASQIILPELRHRVHVDGLDSTGNQIGTYSPEYMIVRTGAYKNAGTITRGVNKGQQKDSGKSLRTGVARSKYNRTSDTKVILSLTRQMEQDLSIIATETGYGIGYLNPFNYQKAIWCEETYGKPILTQLTVSELKLVTETVQDSLQKFITGDLLNT